MNFFSVLTRFVLVLSSVFVSGLGRGQVVYFENFGTGCSTGNLATTFGWTNTNTGVNQATANIWYVSAAENGVGPGNCGVGCGGANSRTLHISAAAAAGGDLGAAYFESSAFICTFVGLCSRTDKRIESPSINCTGISTINFSFDYIENGEGTNDNATVWYSADNGTTWIQIDDPPKTSLCGAQGLWTSRTLTLPSSADNNPAIKIGFRWVNNANGVATDPSFAVDNIQIGLPIILSAEMVEMSVSCHQLSNTIHWKTQSELNAATYNVYKSTDGEYWELLKSIHANNSAHLNTYSITDAAVSTAITYYYIEQVDFNGASKSYAILSSQNCQKEASLVLYPNPSDGTSFTISGSQSDILQVEIFSLEGKRVFTYTAEERSDQLTLQPHLTFGRYVVYVTTTTHQHALPWVVTGN